MSQAADKKPLPENAEPTAGATAITPGLMIAFVLVAFVGFIRSNIAESAQSDFPALVYAPYTDVAQSAAMQTRSPDEKQFDRGAAVYQTICSDCHQSNGAGSVEKNAPPLDGSEWVTAAGPDRLIRIVQHGLSGPVTVKGKVWSAGVMPSVGAPLTDEQVADVLSYIRNSWSNSSTHIHPDKVAEVREAIADRGATPWTVVELEEVNLDAGE
jgi:mono/diheme cytochrome c family protein